MPKKLSKLSPGTQEKYLRMACFELIAMENHLMECEASTSGVYRDFDHEASIAVVYNLCDRVRFPRFAEANDSLALLHEAGQGGR